MAVGKIISADGKIILAGGKIILAGGKIISVGGKIIFAGLVTTRQSHPVRARKAGEFLIMECEEFILPDWSPPDDPGRPCRPKAGHGLVMMMMIMVMMTMLTTMTMVMI